MGPILQVALIIATAFAVALVLLNVAELLKLVRWKLRRCPGCRNRLGFAGWDWSKWHNKNVRHSATVNGETRDLPWVIVTCPHCAFEIAVRKAPVFSAT